MCGACHLASRGLTSKQVEHSVHDMFKCAVMTGLEGVRVIEHGVEQVPWLVGSASEHKPGQWGLWSVLIVWTHLLRWQPEPRKGT